MKHHTIVFTGAPGAGKTTAIATLSDAPPVVTDVPNTDTSLDKERTTVGLDFGQVDLGDGQCVRLFGTPGQLRFEFMWRIIAADALGLVILVDNSQPNPLTDFAVCLDAYHELLPTMNCAVGIGSPRLLVTESSEDRLVVRCMRAQGHSHIDSVTQDRR